MNPEVFLNVKTGSCSEGIQFPRFGKARARGGKLIKHCMTIHPQSNENMKNYPEKTTQHEA